MTVGKPHKPNRRRRPAKVPTNGLVGSDPKFGNIALSLDLSKAIKEMGYISNVKDARKSLENIFKNS